VPAADEINLSDSKTTYRYNVKRSGYADLNITPPLKLKWFFNTNLKKDYIYNPKVNCSLIGEGDTLYFGTLENSFCAFDAAKKEYKWRYNTVGDVQSSAVLFGDKIFFSDTKGYLYCLNKETGEVIWRNEFKNEILSSPLAVEDKIFFTDMDDVLYCITKDSGSILWKVEINNYLRSVVIRAAASPSYGNGLIYQGFSDGYLYCYDMVTSNEVFRKKVKGSGILYDVDSPAAVDGNTVYSSSFDGNFMAINALNSTTKWEIKISGNGYPAFNDDSLIISSNDGILYRVDKDFGSIIWERQLSKNLTPPVITDDYVFTASQDYLYVVDIKSGEVRYEYEPGSGINSELCLINDYVYFMSNKGYLYCFNTS
jgi:outer membrane protein assembly factor BamB